MVTSSSFIAPVATSCFTTRPPACLYTNGTPSSLPRASIGTKSASAILSVSIALPVVMPGRSVESDCSTRTFTSKTFASALGRCSPTFATLDTVPLSRLEGSASSVMATGCPAAILRTSISLTYVTDSIWVRSGSVATAGSQADTWEPAVRFLPFHSFA